MNARPHFVYVSPVLPLPADQGSKRFQLELGRTLRQLGTVQWISREIGDQSEERAQLRSEGFQLGLDRGFVRQDAWHRALRRARIDARAWRWRRPRELAFTCTPPVLRLVERAAQFDGELIGIGAFWHSWRALLALPRARRVLVLSDLEHDRLAAAVRLGLARSSQVERLRAAELEAIAQVGLVLAISPEDRALLEDLARPSGTQVGLWPIAVPLPETMVPRPRSAAALRLLSYGRWEADFNRDGLSHFCAAIWPGLRRAHPGLQMAVGGSGLEGALRAKLAGLGIEVLGWVRSLPEELARAHGVVVPLRYGGGVRYRLLEAFAHGMPCIASPRAARGCGAQAGVHYLEAEEPNAWVAAVGELAQTQRAQELAAAARAFVVERYAGPEVTARALEALQSVLPR